MKRTYQPSRIKRLRKHGFRERMKTKAGRAILKRRRVQVVVAPETGRFRRSDRLLDSRDFRRVLRQGRRRADPRLVLFATRDRRKINDSNDLEIDRPLRPRLGITVSRKVGNAVVRNRSKRRVRAWFRARRAEIGGDLDLVVIARPSAGSLSLDQLDAILAPMLGLEPSPSRARP